MKDYDKFEWEETIMKFLKSDSHDRPRDSFLSELIITEETEKFELSREILVRERDKPNASQTSLLRRIDDTIEEETRHPPQNLGPPSIFTSKRNSGSDRR
jgi:hypothetical protein